MEGSGFSFRFANELEITCKKINIKKDSSYWLRHKNARINRIYPEIASS